MYDMSEQRDTDPLSPGELEMIFTANQSFSVRITDAVRTYTEREVSKITPTGDYQGADAWPHIRVTRTILKLAVSMAKFDVSSEVTAEHVDRAATLLGDINESLGVNGEFDTDVVKTDRSRTITTNDSISKNDVYKELLIKKINQLCDNEDEEPASLYNVLQEFDNPGYDRSIAENAIDLLKQQSDVYEPSTDKLRACRSDHIVEFYGGTHPNMKQLIADLEVEDEEGAPVAEYYRAATETLGLPKPLATYELDRLKQKGEVYEPSTDHLRTI
jgi:DNA replicative helicase MCM subunit Mcm2 (Cdc46/Mcm family)